MNLFRSLRDYLKSLAAGDAEPESEKRPPGVRPVVKPAQRTSQGDGFDAGAGGARVDLRGGLKVPVLEAEEPRADGPFIQPTDFNASLDDLALVDDPLGDQPEFIPEGGMSTESLMREFDTLEPEAVATSAEPALRAADFRDEASSLAPVETAALVIAPSMLELATPEPMASQAPSSSSPAPEGPALLPASVDLAEFATPDSTFAFAASSLSESSFESAPSAPESAQVQPVFEQSSFEESSFEESSFEESPLTPASLKKPERLAPAWLIAPTTAAVKPVASPTGTEFSASPDDLGLLVDEPAPEPEAPESKPTPPRGEGDS